MLLWDPQVILVASDPKNESNVYEQITTGSQWKTIAAVKRERVYQIPRGPFDWFDRPPFHQPAFSASAGWGNLLYPDLYQVRHQGGGENASTSSSTRSISVTRNCRSSWVEA